MKYPITATIAFSLCMSLRIVAEEQPLFVYQPVITQKDRVNSKGVALTDPAAILAQERSNTHKSGQGDDPYFTTPQKRAEISTMLARGDFSADMKNVVLKAKDPVLFISVQRKNTGLMSMHVGMRARDQENLEAIKPEVEAGATADGPARQKHAIDNTHADFQPVISSLEATIEQAVGEPVSIDGTVYLLDGWARVDGNIQTKSGKAPRNEETEYYFDLDLTGLLQKSNGRWKVLTHVVAGDITAEIDIPKQFPSAPKALFNYVPPQVY